MKIPTLPFLFLSLLIGLLASCQKSKPVTPIEWPTISQEAKPWTRWWWQGSSVTKAGITAEMEAYQKAGLGGLEVTPIYGVIGEEEHFIDFLSAEWVDLLVFTLQEADRLGMGIDMATGTGWPFGGPWVSEADACKYMVHKSYSLKEGESLKEPIQYQQEAFVRAVPNQVYQLYGIYKEPGEKLSGSLSQPDLMAHKKSLAITDLVEPVADNKNLQALALDQVRFDKMLPLQTLMAYSDQGETIDLTEKVSSTGQLDWKAPKGNWTLYALFQGWHGKMVERAAPGGEGNVIDHFSAKAIRNYLAPFDSAFAGSNISALRAFFNDSYEVDDARGQANWTPELLAEFQKRRGYDLREQLPALLGNTGSEEQQRRVLSDFRETVSDLVLETFTTEWGQWAKSKGAITRNQSHGSPANILDLYAASDIPETEGTDILRIRFATSAAHVTGKKLASSESATWLNEHFLSNLGELKENLDRYLAGGVNHLLYHGTCYSPPGEEWPGRLFYAAIHANPRNSLWHHFPAINQYVARTQSFLQAGTPDNDVLLYFPAYDRFATPGPELLQHFDGHGPALEGTAFEANANELLKEGYGFDFISDLQIRQLQVSRGALEAGGGLYQTIVVPECQYMPLQTFQKLIDLAQKGSTIIVHKALPLSVPGLDQLADRSKQFQSLLAQIDWHTTSPGMQQAKIGEGTFFMGEDLDVLLTVAGIHKELLVQQGIDYTRRNYENGKVYFLSNWSKKEVDGWVPLQAKALAVARFDPMTGKTGYLKLRTSEAGETEVYLQLPHGASCILQTLPSAAEGEPWANFTKTGTPIELQGKWSLSFLTGGPELAPAMEITQLNSWTDLGLASLKNFSGTAQYSITFPKPPGASPGWMLDLGSVHESAQLRLNGESIGTLIGPDYQLFIASDLFTENNTLEIEVSNLMANRIADLDRRGIPWKKFYNVNFPARRGENRGKNGLLDTSNWEPLPSGLLGPVTLTPIKIMD